MADYTGLPAIARRMKVSPNTILRWHKRDMFPIFPIGVSRKTHPGMPIGHVLWQTNDELILWWQHKKVQIAWQRKYRPDEEAADGRGREKRKEETKGNTR